MELIERKQITLFLFLIVTTLCFHELSYSGIIYFSMPDKQLILLLLLISSIIFLRGSSLTFDNYEVSYIFFILYANLITFINIYFIPNLSEVDSVSQNKYVFLSIYNIIFTLIIAFNSILKTAAIRRIEIKKIFFNFIFFYIIIALMFYFLKIIGLNPNSIGVSDTYGFIRLQGLMPEPSFISIQIIITLIYFINVRKKLQTFICFISLILTFSSTAILLLLIYFFIRFLRWRKKGLINYALFLFILLLMIVLLFLLFIQITNYSNEKIVSFVFIRIIGHLKAFFLNFLDLVNGKFYYTNYYYAPRVKTFFSNVYLIIENNWFLGNGFGSQIFFLDNWHGSFVSVILAHLIEIGIVGVCLEMNIITIILKNIKKEDRSIIYMILIYWLINSQVFFILLYVVGPILFYSNKYNIKKSLKI